MIPKTCRFLSVLLLIATGCTYNPVRYDPASGFQSGGGVGVLCGGPLDPWMTHCGPECGRECGCDGLGGCLGRLLCPARWCQDSCCPAPCGSAPCCPAPCPAPACQAPVCPTPCGGMPMGVSPYSPVQNWPAAAPMMPMPAAPYASPQVYGPAPTPTFAPSCPSCGSAPSAGIPGYPQTAQIPMAAGPTYSQLFQGPPMAPPAQPQFPQPQYAQPQFPQFPQPQYAQPQYAQPQFPLPQFPQPQYGDPFMMPTPVAEGEIPPSSGQLPPHYEEMETPAGQALPGTPMNTQPPGPAPAPTGIPASQTSFPRLMTPSVVQQGAVPTGAMQYDSRSQQWIPIRL